jgi:glycosyltransferase involved in cell wall biosynthesis
MTAKQLSILITYYNEGPLLTECLQSLLSSEDVPDELLIYDDASDLPAQDYIIEHPNLRLFRGDINRGASYSRNYLLNKSTSEYVHFHDTDDLFCNNFCAKIREKISLSHPDIVINNFTFSDSNQIGFFDFQSIISYSDIPIFFISGKTSTQILTFRRNLGLKIGGYQTHNLEAALDYYFNIMLSMVAQTYEIIDDPLVIVRLRENSLTRTFDSQRRAKHPISVIKALLLLKKYLPDTYSNLMAQIIVTKASWLYQNGYKNEARWGFQQAKEMGNPDYRNYNLPMKFVAQKFNPELSESLAQLYRSGLPHSLRKTIKNFIQ